MARVIAVCPNCQKKYRVDFQLIGRTTTCKQCNESFEISASSDSDDSFGLPNAKQYLADQPFDPLAPEREGDDDPSQTYETGDLAEKNPTKVKARDWKKELKKSRRDSPFGPLQRTLLGIGTVLAVAGIAINLVHLFGLQLGEGNIGRYIGLAVGLVGAGLVGASLLKFPASSRIAGATTALVVFLAFLATLINARNQGLPQVENEVETEGAGTIASFKSIWINEFPKWVGFDEMERMPSVADRWNRHQIGGTEISASFLGEPKSVAGRIRVARTNVRTQELKTEVNGFKFSVMTFKFPTARSKPDKLKLNESEAAFGEIEFAKSMELDGCIGKEYHITSSSMSTHGRFFLVDGRIVHIKVEGSVMVPGVLSGEFLESLQVRSDGNDKNAKAPEFELTDKQREQLDEMSKNTMEIEVLISEHIRSGGLMNFPQAYLSISVGKDEGNRRFLVHPGKLPIAGVDLTEVRTKTGALIANISPIYDEATDENSIMAEDGYALAGLEVNSGNWIKGVRLVFMKTTDVGFDTSKSYRTKWYGTRASGVPRILGGDGRPVYGFWMCRTKICKSIGLIRENN